MFHSGSSTRKTSCLSLTRFLTIPMWPGDMTTVFKTWHPDSGTVCLNKVDRRWHLEAPGTISPFTIVTRQTKSYWPRRKLVKTPVINRELLHLRPQWGGWTWLSQGVKWQALICSNTELYSWADLCLMSQWNMIRCESSRSGEHTHQWHPENIENITTAIVLYRAWSIFTLAPYRCRRVLLSFHASTCPSVRLSVCPFICLSWNTSPHQLFKDFSYRPEIWTGWCTVPWSRSLFKMAMFEIFHDRLGSGLRDDVTTLTL